MGNKKILKQVVTGIIKPLITIVIALIIGVFVILASGESPIRVYSALLTGAFGSVPGWLGTLTKATPFIFTGVAAAVAMKSGIFNIGIDGQMVLGALGAAIAGKAFEGLPAVALVPLCTLFGILAASAWAMFPAILSRKLGINLFVLFFMMNNMAVCFADYMASGPAADPMAGMCATPRLAAEARYPRFVPISDLNIGFVLAIVIALVAYVVLYKTVLGYECSAVGLNSTFGQYIGIDYNKTFFVVLLASSAIAGLAGAEQVQGVMGRYISGFSNATGFTGIACAMLSGNNPLGALVFGIFFGVLTQGGQYMQASIGLTSDLVGVLRSIIMIFISIDFLVSMRTVRKKLSKKEGLA